MKPVILHLSDIHRTQDEQVPNSEILHALKADIERFSEEDIPRPNVIVISGDIVQSATPSEYGEAKRFIEELLSFLSLDGSRLVLVPGNHDIHWPTAEEAFVLKRSAPRDLSTDLQIPIQGRMLCARSDESYQKRFDNFRDFYRDLTGVEYPQSRGQQWTFHEISELGIAFVGFNSCDLNDHERFQGHIHPDAIAAAADKLTAYEGVAIAVWHHDIDWRNENLSDCLDLDSIRLMSQRAISLGLCGHQHRPAQNNTFVLDSYPLPIVAAGSLCAGPRQRRESVPRSYNVIEIGGGAAKIFVREKDSRTAPWKGVGRFRSPTSRGNYVSWISIPLATPASASGQLAPPSTAPTKSVPKPFMDHNAKFGKRSSIMSEYVWTKLTDEVDSDVPQLVLGPRGSGKTALLLSLTFDGRRLNPKFSPESREILSRVGLLCPMKVAEITAFAGKGWLDEIDRSRYFAAFVATIWGEELVNTLENISAWARSFGFDVPSEQDIGRIVGGLWLQTPSIQTYSECRIALKNLRSKIVSEIGNGDASVVKAALGADMRLAISRSGVGPLQDVATELAHWELYRDTHWFVLFDEVEFLNEWQQRVVYDFLGITGELVSCKIATLPYAHARALQSYARPLVEGEDYKELTITLSPELETQEDSGSDARTFISVATGIWQSRIQRITTERVGLDHVWPEVEYEVVTKKSRKKLEQELIEALPLKVQQRARKLRENDHIAFSDQYWRKYQQPFRFRYAKASGAPMYWGWRSLLRACDGNCRRFLQLADICWNDYWEKSGIRPLSPQEQHNALKQLGNSRYRKLQALTEKGPELKNVVDQVSHTLQTALYERRHISQESLNVQIREFTASQADAIAVGIANGVLVPKLSNADDVNQYAYPKTDIELRLGFPIAVAKELPLRVGSTIKIADLRQVFFSWWED